MKALFYGGAIASLAGLALGMGMKAPPQPAPVADDVQPIAQQAPDGARDAAAYGAGVDSYPQSYVIDAAYNGQPVTELGPQAATYDEPAADRVIQASWTEPAATPQDVAAAGDTSTAPAPEAPAPEVRTYASIDAVLNQQQAEQGRNYGPRL